MQLVCSFCQRSFDSMFGPPHARCPDCGSDEVRNPLQPVAPPAQEPEPYRWSVFNDGARQPDAPPQSVPSHVLSTNGWMAASVALTLFCQPIGMAGIYYVDRARNLARHGDLDEARQKLGYAQGAVIAGWVTVAIAAIVGTALVLSG